METLGRGNPKIKLARSLRQRKVRDAEGLFVAEGTFHLGTALEAGAPIEYVLFAQELLGSPFAKELLKKIEAKGISCFQTAPDTFETLSDKENPQGLIAVVRQGLTPLETLAPRASSICVAIVTPQDPGNVGTILRTMDAAGADGLLLLDGGVDAYHPGAVRAGMGAHFAHPIVETSFADFASWAQRRELHIYGSSAHATQDYSELRPERPAVLLLGSEREGLSAEQLSVCEQVVSIQMRGKVTSLNLAVAAGILLYELSKR
jgi:TrmH family RNA methyltransferase